LKALTKEELRLLSFGVLREWWLSATQALVDSAGSEKALEHLKPYFLHMGKAGAININAWTDSFMRDRPSGAWIQRCAVGGKQGRIFRAGDGTVIEGLVECETMGKSREACICLCSYCMSSGSEETNSKMDYVLIGSLSTGDPECRWLIKWKNRMPMVAPTEEFLTHDYDEFPKVINEDLIEYLGLSMLGESVMNCTKAFIDFVGPDETMKALSGHMRRSGQSLGKMFESLCEGHEADTVALSGAFELLNKIHQREGHLSTSLDGVEGTISKCPFSDAPNEFCHLHESFCNGICEAIKPNYTFSYDRMMTKGERSCHWVIREQEPRDAATSEESERFKDIAKNLALRLSKGEITLEEFERNISSLRKHGLIK